MDLRARAGAGSVIGPRSARLGYWHQGEGSEDSLLRGVKFSRQEMGEGLIYRNKQFHITISHTFLL